MARIGERRAPQGIRRGNLKESDHSKTRRRYENNIKGDLISVARHG